MPQTHLFIDTNILVYAHDQDAGQKRAVAARFVEALFNRPYPPAISVQVLNELYVNLLKGTTAKIAAEICEGYCDWEVIPLTLELFRESVATQERYKISLWDGLVIEAARKARATKIVSEDLSHGQKYRGIEVVNLFKAGKDWEELL